MKIAEERLRAVRELVAERARQLLSQDSRDTRQALFRVLFRERIRSYATVVAHRRSVCGLCGKPAKLGVCAECAKGLS